MLKVEELESRLVPTGIPGWDGPTQSAVLADWAVVSGAGVGGGPRLYIENADGSERVSLFAFEESFRGGIQLAVGPDRIYVGAGPGGGPVLVEYDFQGNELSRGYQGDPSLRNGFDPAVLASRVDPTSPQSIQVPVASKDIFNTLDGSSGSTRQTGGLYATDIGPTPFGIGIVFTTPSTDDQARVLLPGQVRIALQDYFGDYYVAIGPSIDRAKTCLQYVEVNGDSMGADAIAVQALILLSRI